MPQACIPQDLLSVVVSCHRRPSSALDSVSGEGNTLLYTSISTNYFD